MQKKVGIRLRHLQGPPEPPRQQQVVYKTQPAVVQQNRKRQHSPSPVNRRKIFPQPYPEQRYQQPVQPMPTMQKITKKAPAQISRATTVMMSPIMNQPLNSNNVSINDGNYEYESQVQRLIDSLKKKSVELEKKQEVINKLNKQVEYLLIQNREYWQQIKTLKAQLQFERASHSNTQRSQISQNQKHPKMPNKQTIPINNKNPKNQYTNEGYEEEKSPIVHVKINTSKPGYRQEEPKPKFNRVAPDHNRQQDSVLSDYLSPLMVLNEPMTKSASPIYQNPAERNTVARTSKTNSRIQYNIRQQTKEQPYTSNRTNPNYIQSPVENPFARKAENYPVQRQPSHQQYHHQPQFQQPDRYLYESAGNFGNTHSLNQRQFDREYQRQRGWPTLESSAAHFNMVHENIQDQQQNQYNNGRKRQKKQLAIDDSKQFRFQDFDFSQLDNSAVHSQF